jgi:predicted lipoprotein with Yx(FWY)xxD motif
MQEIRHRMSQEGEWARPRVLTCTIVVLTLTAALGVAGFLAAGSIANSATRTNATVVLRKTKLGPILVNARAHTIYLFAKDQKGKSACSASCARFWPPLLTKAKPTAGAGVNAALLGTTKRSSGELQVTYNKHPLYTFLLDKRAGQTNGEANLAFGAKWYAVSAKGAAVIKAPPTLTSTTTTTATTTSTTPCAYPPCP